MRRPLGQQVSRVVRKQLKRAIKAVAHAGISFEERVHVARTSCKKIRAALLLVRSSHPKVWRRENAFFRDAAHELAPLREATAISGTAVTLLTHFADELDPRGFVSLRRKLGAHCRGVLARRSNNAATLGHFGRQMRAAQRRFEKLKLKSDAAEVCADFAATYRRARRIWRTLTAGASGAEFHKARKRTKAHAYHWRLFRAAWPEMMAPREKALGTLGDLLGEEHDLTVLEAWLSAHGSEMPRDPLSCLQGVISARRDELQRQALRLGRRLFVDKPCTIARRISAWREMSGGGDGMKPAH